MTEFSYAISLDATGDHGVAIQNPDLDDGFGGDSYIRAEPFANLPFAIDDLGAIIRVCDSQCLYGDITSTPELICVPNCTGLGSDVSFDDVLCALNGFALAADCPCADIAGPTGALCIPDGVINFDDILAILTAFAGDSACPCA
ncbi:MAG: hypothetical protein IIB61_06675 [Planctomycetes bacterium]|nr:hypothetical protein [Planctomycetota bacterium]